MSWVRLLEIDAPEKAQAFGTKSKEALSEMCFGETAELADKGKDRYGRTLARVACYGVDANAEQVRPGMAWVMAWVYANMSPTRRFTLFRKKPRQSAVGCGTITSQCRRGRSGIVSEGLSWWQIHP